MTANNLNTAQAYYTAMGNKNLAEMAKCIHPEVKFLAPLAQLQGKDAVVAAAEKFLHFFTSVKLRAKFADADQVMVAYDLTCPPPMGIFRAAALLTFVDGLIIGMELFFDARPFEIK